MMRKGLAVVAQREPTIGPDNPPPRHAAALESHDPAHLSRAPDTDDLGDGAVVITRPGGIRSTTVSTRSTYSSWSTAAP